MKMAMWSNLIIAVREAVDQALRARGSREFASRAAYEHFLQNLIHKRNHTRAEKFTAEKAALRPLPSRELAPCKELQVVVSQFSTITVATIMRDKLRKVNLPISQACTFPSSILKFTSRTA
jgi:predicted RNA-binding Zn ribbon-like protein